MVAIERSKGLLQVGAQIDTGVVGQSELTTAYTILGGGITEETSARRVVEIYKSTSITNPNRLGELKQALITIATHRDCFKIQHFLQTGQLPSFSDSNIHDCADLYLFLY